MTSKPGVESGRNSEEDLETLDALDPSPDEEGGDRGKTGPGAGAVAPGLEDGRIVERQMAWARKEDGDEASGQLRRSRGFGPIVVLPGPRRRTGERDGARGTWEGGRAVLGGAGMAATRRGGVSLPTWKETSLDSGAAMRQVRSTDQPASGSGAYGRIRSPPAPRAFDRVHRSNLT